MILTDQLDKSYDQAVDWLESLGPLYKTMRKGQMSEQVAWQTFLIYYKFRVESSVSCL